MTTSDPSESFQLSVQAAEFYESAFVPAFFAQWAPMLCEAAGVVSDDAVLDVACGTGVVARTAAGLVAPGGRVVGLDLNKAMLSVACRMRPDIEWRQGDATSLPLDDETFDAALCQMALMFFPDRAEALTEMRRVVRAGGAVALAVPSRLDTQAAFAPFVMIAGRHAGADAMSLLGAYFVCGDLDDLTSLVESAGLNVISARTHTGTYRAPSVDAFVTTEVESTPLHERISADTYARIRADAHDALEPFTNDDGSVEAPFQCNIVAARRP